MAAPTPDKLVVSNVAQLAKKYGSAGAGAVVAAVKKLIAADAKRHLVTRFVDLSDRTTMKRYGATALTAAQAADPRANKKAIDKVFTSLDPRPAYLMLLGSTDVIPHVPLDNPMAGDGDPDLPSDLPYACDAAYSTDVQDFTAPTRVVGRLPNVTNDTGSAYLVRLLGTAANYTQRPPTDFNSFLGLSAQVWKKSSQLSLDAVFGTHAGMKVSPPNGYKWTTAEARRLTHFVNCHGASADPNFYGQKGSAYPVAHAAGWMGPRLVAGTVMAAECCYGAQLYDPALPTAGNQMGMCNTYLGAEAYAYFGSTNIAYGPATTTDQADLMCQFFLLHLLGGASAGRAGLQARLDYVKRKGGVLAPADLKTLGQFTVMADPALTPVAGPPLTAVPVAGPAGAKSATAATAAVARHDRLNRRVGLVLQAAATTAYRLFAPTGPLALVKSAAFGRLRQAAADLGLKAPDVMISYTVTPPAGGVVAKAFGVAKTLGAEATAQARGPRAIHTLLKRDDPPAAVPYLPLVRGVQAIEYADGMDVQAFGSR